MDAIVSLLSHGVGDEAGEGETVLRVEYRPTQCTSVMGVVGSAITGCNRNPPGEPAYGRPRGFRFTSRNGSTGAHHLTLESVASILPLSSSVAVEFQEEYYGM